MIWRTVSAMVETTIVRLFLLKAPRLLLASRPGFFHDAALDRILTFYKVALSLLPITAVMPTSCHRGTEIALVP